MWNVKPGDLVVCIKRDAWRGASSGLSGDGPAYGSINTVAYVSHSKTYGTILWLEGWWPCFVADRFRPVQKPSIESLRGLLVPTRDKELTDA